MEQPNPNAIYAQVNMALKRKNRRNSTSKSDSEGKSVRKKPAGPPQRPPPVPPPAYSIKKPPVAPKKPSLPSPSRTPPQQQTNSPPSRPPTLPKPPAIAKKASQLIAEKRLKTAPPKPIPYHIYIRTKHKRQQLNGREGGENKENRPTVEERDSDSDGSTSS